MELFFYLAKVSACTAVFYLLYHVFLAKLTFFSLNRWYLLGTLVLSFAIPLLSITIEREVMIPASTIKETTSVAGISNTQSNAIDPEFAEDHSSFAINQISFEMTLTIIYLAVFVFLLIRLIISIASILWKSRKYEYKGKLKYIAVSPSCSYKNSSFHRYLFIDESLPDAMKKQVIHHEQIHIKSFHFMDKLLASLSTAILWFNPFVYFYLNAIDANHEFEADAKSTLHFDKKSYANLIFNLAKSSNNLLINHFSKLPLKRRMTMLFQNPTTQMKKIIYFSVLPVIAICCLAFVNQKEVLVYVKSASSGSGSSSFHEPEKVVKKVDTKKGPEVKKIEEVNNLIERETIGHIKTQQISRINTENFTIQPPVIKFQRTLVIDPGHGGKDRTSESITGVPEKEMTLKAALILKEEAEKRGIKVIMTRDKDEFVGLYERRDIANMGDAFISLHFNQMPLNPNPNGFRGIEVFVCKESRATTNLKDSQILGSNVLKALKSIKGIEVRDSVKRMSMAVLTNEVVPSIVIELGNISYQESFDFVSDEANLRRICNLILDGYEKSGC